MTKKNVKKREEQFDEAHYRSWHLASSPHDAITTDFEWGIMRFHQA